MYFIIPFRKNEALSVKFLNFNKDLFCKYEYQKIISNIMDASILQRKESYIMKKTKLTIRFMLLGVKR